MKYIALAILLLSAVAARADEPAMTDAQKLAALIRLNDATQAEANAAKSNLIVALQANRDALAAKINDDAIAAAAVKAADDAKRAAEKDAEEAKSTWGYIAGQWIKRGIYILAGMYVFVWISGFINPLGSFGWMFRLGQFLISNLPLARFAEIGHPTEVVRARTVPVVGQ